MFKKAQKKESLVDVEFVPRQHRPLSSEIYFPKESYGECQVKVCRQFKTVLADGFCVYHWDMNTPN